MIICVIALIIILCCHLVRIWCVYIMLLAFISYLYVTQGALLIYVKSKLTYYSMKYQRILM